jgi:hypothetical protein
MAYFSAPEKRFLSQLLPLPKNDILLQSIIFDGTPQKGRRDGSIILAGGLLVLNGWGRYDPKHARV